MADELTSSQVNKAGRILRHWLHSLDVHEPSTSERVRAALRVMFRFRAAHAYPLTKANNGLRSMIRSEGCAVEVSQRLKRAVTILNKLEREPSLALATMQDVGGCRALFESVAEVRRVEQRIRRNHPPIRISDYIKRPRASGYRAVHVVVRYKDQQGVARAIELQLRTRTMHEWAIAVERLSGQRHEDLKSGAGPREIHDWLIAISEAMALEEAGSIVPELLAARIVALRAAAVPFFERVP